MNLATIKKAVPPNVALMVVSKTRTRTDLLPLLQSGHRLFGENRVQEAEEKWPEIKKEFLDVKLHFIGHLQSNKSADAVRIFDGIQSLDRPDLARSIAKEMRKQNKTPELYIQVNTGEEPQKGGVLPQDLQSLFDLCTQELNLRIKGLMCIPPVGENPALHFALLRKLGSDLGLQHFSMGMSADYESAIRHGSTMIRLGSAVFATGGGFY
jgi:pyridoxal phosphate enzyme (YggS family)